MSLVRFHRDHFVTNFTPHKLIDQAPPSTLSIIFSLYSKKQSIIMFACQRIAASSISKRQFHTIPAMLAESEGLFGKLNPWAKKEQPQQQVTPAQHTSEEAKVTFNVKYEDEDDIVS